MKGATGGPGDVETGRKRMVKANGHSTAAEVKRRARKIRLLAFDVDGVLTDGRVTFTSHGEEVKSFDIKDGHALKLAGRHGIAVAFITGRESIMVDRRAAELGVTLVFQGAKDKATSLRLLLSQTGLSADEVAYMGDDLVDLPVMRRVGLACAVSDAVPEVLERAHWVSKAQGGRGAARELVAMVMEAQGLWDQVLEHYQGL